MNSYWVVMIFHAKYEPEYRTCRTNQGALEIAAQALDQGFTTRIKEYEFSDNQFGDLS